jgi:hypothetical protein
LLGYHGKALSARNESHASASASYITPTEEFDLVQHEPGKFGLRTVAGKFLSAMPSGIVEANRLWLRDWELFRLVPAREGRFGVLTFHEKFLSAYPDGALDCARVWLREWEEFYLYSVPDVDSLAGGFGPLSNPSTLELFERCRAHATLSDESARSLVGLRVFPNPYPDASREARNSPSRA